MIPDHWSREPISKICEYSVDCVNRTAPTVESETAYLMIRTSNVRDGKIRLNDIKYVSKEVYLNWTRRLVPQIGDVILTREAPVGEVGMIDGNEKVFLGQRLFHYRPNKDIIYPKYLLLALLSPATQKHINGMSFGATVEHIKVEDALNIPICFPCLSEQVAIADLLSTWAEAIEKTERLIAAKEKRFTSLTQKLIHNRSERLQHFHLGEICELVKRKNTINELNVLTTSAQHGLISQMDYYKKSVSAEDVRGYYLLKKGEFAYNRSSSNGYPYGAIKRLEGYPQGVLSTLYLCFALKNDAPCDSDFMAHAFEAGLLNKQLVGVCQEGARSHGLLNITKSDFFGLKIKLPAVAEQQKIAAIFTAARQEIVLLNKQSEALRQQKRGLMQKLLTGVWKVTDKKVNL